MVNCSRGKLLGWDSLDVEPPLLQVGGAAGVAALRRGMKLSPCLLI